MSSLKIKKSGELKTETKIKEWQDCSSSSIKLKESQKGVKIKDNVDSKSTASSLTSQSSNDDGKSNGKEEESGKTMASERYSRSLLGEEDILGEGDEESENVEKLTRFNVYKMDYEDADEAQQLLDDVSKEMFNVENVYEKIHLCSFSYKLTTSKGKMVAALILEEYPNIPAIYRGSWCGWLNLLYGLKNVTSFNALWVHLAIYHKKYARGFLHPFMNYLFHKFIKKLYILFVIPPHCLQYVTYLNATSTLILPVGHANHERVQTLRLCVRQDFVTNYKIRRAVEEDNDDLVPLIDKHCKRFVEMYGEFYISEIITRHPESGRRLIVAEINGSACAVLCLNKTVNYKELNDAFELHNFTNLYNAETATIVHKEPKTPSQIDMGRQRKEQLKKQKEEEVEGAERRRGESQISKDEKGGLINPSNGSNDEIFDVSKGNSFTSDILSFAHESNNCRSFLDGINVCYNHSTKSLVDVKTAVSWDPSDFIGADDLSLDSETDMSQSEFTGEGNAFAIEIIAAHEMHRASLPLLLIASFECFPDKDYALLMMPHVTDDDIVRYFVRISPKMRAYHPHDLYLCHRGQLLPVKVKRADAVDESKVEKFTSFLKQPGVIMDNFLHGLKSCKDLFTFLVMSGENDLPIGLIQLHRLSDFATIKSKYSLSHNTDIRKEPESSYGVIEVFALSPLFKGPIKYILRELHRKTDFSTLLYATNRHDGEPYRCRPLMAAADVLSMVPPKRQMTLEEPATYPEEPFSLFVCTPRLLNRDKLHINLRIVIVGSSRTALSFIRELQSNKAPLSPMTFNNMLLVSKDGLSQLEPSEKLAHRLRAHKTVIDSAYLNKVGLRSRLSVVTGTLTAINRRDQFIEVNGKVNIDYDYLFLMCGVQYALPKKTGAKLDYLKMKIPPDMFIINTVRSANAAIKSMQELIAKENCDGQIVVYGRHLDAFCCLSVLLDIGFNVGRLILIIPEPPKDQELHHNFIFQDGDVYEKVFSTIELLGITIYESYTLIDWHANENESTTLRFESKTRFLNLQPVASFIYSEKTVDVRAFHAAYEAGLVYDGRLVINTQFRTNDPSIYAAGTMTKYTRKLWAQHLVHKNFQSEEVGAYLAKRIKKEVGSLTSAATVTPVLNNYCSVNDDSSRLVPIFHEPRLCYCKLPGNLYYLHVCAPGATVPLEAAMSDNDYGSLLATGNCKNLNQQGYFRIHLNVNRIVETITCLSAVPFNYKKLILLWGKHESLLNNMVRRFESVYITDLFNYFERPWATALFHDNFHILERTIMKIMMSKSEDPGSSPFEDLYSMYTNNGFSPLSDDQIAVINRRFRNSGYALAIQKAIMTFICDNLATLDMYAHPVIVNYILSTGFDNSPLFMKI